MNRWLAVVICVICGLSLLCCGLLVPAYIRSVDREVLRMAGRKTTPLVETGFALLKRQEQGPARLLLTVAQAKKVPGRDKLEKALQLAEMAHPESVIWGRPEPKLVSLIGVGSPNSAMHGTQRFTEFA